MFGSFLPLSTPPPSPHPQPALVIDTPHEHLECLSCVFELETVRHELYQQAG